MVRYQYIYNQVLQIYRSMETVIFPIEPETIICTRSDCRIMTYSKLSEINKCSLDDIISLCESKSGCTSYDPSTKRYLILWNDDSGNYNVDGRKRWTKAHELGHVILKHLSIASEMRIYEKCFNNITAPELENEADHFAATLLSPMPLFDLLDITSPIAVHDAFGLSMEASTNRWNEYRRWKISRRKTAWENDMRRIFLQKYKNR